MKQNYRIDLTEIHQDHDTENVKGGALPKLQESALKGKVIDKVESTRVPTTDLTR